MSDDDRTAQIAHENKMMRRLRVLVELTFATIAQDDTMTLEEGWDHVRALKGAAASRSPSSVKNSRRGIIPGGGHENSAIHRPGNVSW